MWAKARNVFEEHRQKIMTAFFLVIVGIWLSEPFHKLLPFEALMGITTSAILLFMFIVLDYLISLAKPEGLVEIYSDEHDVTDRLLHFIREERARHVKMIEYSSKSVEPLIGQFMKPGGRTQIELLITHPKHALTKFQRSERVCAQIKTLAHVVASSEQERQRLKIKCYTQRASIRGRQFDERLIAVGWYTYDVKKGEEVAIGQEQIWGDKNAIVVADLRRRRERPLAEMFNRVFRSLWDDGTPIIKVCNECSEDCTGRPADDWLKDVSPDDTRRSGGRESETST